MAFKCHTLLDAFGCKRITCYPVGISCQIMHDLLPPWSRVLLEKLTGFQLVKKFPTYYGTRRFIMAVTSAHHPLVPILCQLNPAHTPTAHFLKIQLNIIHLGLPSSLFPSGFPTNTLYMPLFSPIRDTCPNHLILLNFITQTIFLIM